MKRFLVERTFKDGLNIPMDSKGNGVCQAVVSKNLAHNVVWLFSYVNPEKTKTYCIYDAESPEAVQQAARDNNLPIDRITEVRVLDPYFYH